MRVVLYMAQTLNGYIAREDDETPWSKEEWNAYYSAVREAGNTVIGRRTYDLMKNTNAFKKCGDPFVVVLSKKNHVSKENVVFAKTPESAIRILRAKKFKVGLVGGGSKVSYSFLKSRLIDEIIIDIEAFVFGKGIRLFQKNDLQVSLNLVKVRKLSSNLVQLHYKIKKLERMPVV